MRIASSVDLPTACGHPPLHSKSAISPTPPIEPSAGLTPSPENNASSETAPDEMPSSRSVIVSMRSLDIRPTPLCIGCAASRGVAEPVRINWPGSPPLASHSKRTASQMPGASCHSSTSLGTGPTIALAGSSSASCRAAKPPDGSDSESDDAANRLDVVVLPHHLGP